MTRARNILESWSWPREPASHYNEIETKTPTKVFKRVLKDKYYVYYYKSSIKNPIVTNEFDSEADAIIHIDSLYKNPSFHISKHSLGQDLINLGIKKW